MPEGSDGQRLWGCSVLHSELGPLLWELCSMSQADTSSWRNTMHYAWRTPVQSCCAYYKPGNPANIIWFWLPSQRAPRIKEHIRCPGQTSQEMYPGHTIGLHCQWGTASLSRSFPWTQSLHLPAQEANSPGDSCKESSYQWGIPQELPTREQPPVEFLS